MRKMLARCFSVAMESPHFSLGGRSRAQLSGNTQLTPGDAVTRYDM